MTPKQAEQWKSYQATLRRADPITAAGMDLHSPNADWCCDGCVTELLEPEPQPWPCGRYREIVIRMLVAGFKDAGIDVGTEEQT